MFDSKKEFCQVCNQEKEGRFCFVCNQETSSRFEVHITETIVAKETLGIKQKRAGISGWVREIIAGFRPSVNIEKQPGGVDLSRNIDRLQDRYDEVVKDYETKEIVHEVHEPLNDHFGHGSAKFKKNV
ncbi:MAG: hypothetical protein HGB37_04245 [Candidatus Moranbacteria bacterium]|nr:hypothetical protein [Candidatus Moranbacteria bacterium]